MSACLDGRLILVVVLTSYCIFCACVGLLFPGESEKEICLHHRTLPCSRFANYSVKGVAIEHCVTPARCRFLGHRHTRKRERGELQPGPGVSGRKEQSRIGGFLWCSLSRSEERSGDQSGLFYVAGARLWSPRVTYSTHFIKFTSVLIADQ